MQEGLLFDLRLDVSEVGVLVQVEGLALRETFESTVPGYFVVLGEAHGALRDNVAVVLDGQDGVEQAVDFLQVDFHEVRQRIIFHR